MFLDHAQGLVKDTLPNGEEMIETGTGIVIEIATEKGTEKGDAEVKLQRINSKEAYRRGSKRMKNRLMKSECKRISS